MPLTTLDHVNILTANIATMTQWYADVLGLHAGPRPDFDNVGAWLYLDDRPVVHLVQVDETPTGYAGVRMEHVAFRANGYAAFVATLDGHNIAHTIAHVPGSEIAQVNVQDPDGNHLHIDFDLSAEPS